jgi:hypothetical protein
MKLKSFVTGVLTALLFFTGRSLMAQENTIIPPPDRDSSVLSAPDRESTVILPPEGISELPPSFLPPPVELQADVKREVPADTAKAPEISQTEDLQPADGDSRRPAAPAAASRKSRITVPRKGLYLGMMSGMTVPNYKIDDTDWESSGGGEIDGNISFSGGLLFGVDFGLLAGEVEILVAGDSADIPARDITLTGVSLLIPFIFKMDFHLGPVVLQPLAGPYLNFALGKLRSFYGRDPYANPLFGLMFGGIMGFNLGRGILYLDSRYAIDLGKTKAGTNPMTVWRRGAFMLTLGYQIYVGRKN